MQAIIVSGSPEEIAALAVAVQERREEPLVKNYVSSSDGKE